jgi:hypothetical protein
VDSDRVEHVACTESRRFEEEFARRGRPVVLTGLVADWPALRWDVARLSAHWPARVIDTVQYPSGNQGSALKRHAGRVDVRDLIAALAVGRTLPPDALTPHLSIDLRSELPELLPDVPAPKILRSKTLATWLTVGRDTFSDAHYHTGTHALVAQIYGKKRALLYRPEDSRLLYPYPVYHHHFNTSRVDVVTPDFAKFPKFRAARALEAVLEPGDALFIPVHYWHAIQTEGISLSAALFWKARVRELSFPVPGFQGMAGKFLSRLTRAGAAVFGRQRAQGSQGCCAVGKAATR